MEILCPSCRKANTVEPCQRCGCELGALFAAQAAAAAHLAAGAEALRAGDAPAAREAAARAWRLVHSPEAARLGFLASLGGGDTGRWLARATG